MEYKFDKDIEVRRVSDTIFEAIISPDWNIAAPNGGYLMAIAGTAMKQNGEFPIPLSITGYYHRPTAEGRAELVVKELSRNRRIVTSLVSLRQNGAEVITYIGAFTMDGAFEGPSFSASNGADIPLRADCAEVTGIPFSFFKQVRLIAPPEEFAWMGGSKSEESSFSGYFEFADGRPLDAMAVLLFADSTPPPVLRREGPLAWVPTIELSVQIRKIPEGKSLKFLSKTNYATNGLVETDVELWDESGEIIALSRQLAMVKTKRG
jgi:hypothetical protein